MLKFRSAIKWQNYELKRLEARIEKEITENEDITVSSDKRTKLEGLHCEEGRQSLV